MSESIKATVFYGWKLPALAVESDDLNEEWEAAMRPRQPEDDSDIKTTEWDQWREKFEEWKKTAENVRIDFSGYSDELTNFVHCPAFSITTSDREITGMATCMTRGATEVAQLWELRIPAVRAADNLRAFCDRFNLPNADPCWWLAAQLF